MKNLLIFVKNFVSNLLIGLFLLIVKIFRDILLFLILSIVFALFVFALIIIVISYLLFKIWQLSDIKRSNSYNNNLVAID
jgi:hypothetical protein